MEELVLNRLNKVFIFKGNLLLKFCFLLPDMGVEAYLFC